MLRQPHMHASASAELSQLLREIYLCLSITHDPPPGLRIDVRVRGFHWKPTRGEHNIEQATALPKGRKWYLMFRSGGVPSTSVHLCGPEDMWNVIRDQTDLIEETAAIISAEEKETIEGFMHTEAGMEADDRLNM
ncbi:hypothetical protein PSPO01_16240 [Paraphaeosphaeria sporulosa]